MKIRSSRTREIALVAAVMLVAGLAFTYPLARHFSTDILYTHHPIEGYERVPLEQGDHLHLFYHLWLFKDSVLSGRSFFVDPYQFQYGSHKEFLFQISLLPVVFAVLSIAGDVAAYNMLTILSFVFSGLSAYLLFRLDTADRWAAFLGCLVVALFPYRVAQLAGHANGFLFFLIPLYLYLFERSVRGERWLAYGLAAGVTFFLTGTMEFHLVYYLTLLMGLYLPFRFVQPLSSWLVPNPGAGATAPPAAGAADAVVFAAGASAAMAVFGGLRSTMAAVSLENWFLASVLGGLVLWGFWRLAVRAVLPHSSFDPGRFIWRSALPFAPLTILSLYPAGQWAGLPAWGRNLGIAAGVGAAGLLIFSVAGLFRTFRLREGWKANALARLRPFGLQVLFYGATFGFLIGIKKWVFGPSVAGGGRSMAEVRLFSPRLGDLFAASHENAERFVYVGVVALLIACLGLFLWRNRESEERRGRVLFFAVVFALAVVLAVGPHLDAFPLYHGLFKTLPFFNYPRVAGRYILLASLALGFMAAFGAEVLRARLAKRWSRSVLAVGAALLIVADYAPRNAMGITALPDRSAVYDRLAREMSPADVVLELPIWPGVTAWSSIYQYTVTRYRYRMVNGYSPATSREYVEKVFKPLYPMDFGEVRETQYEFMRRNGIRFVVMHEEAFPEKISPFPPSLTNARLARSPYLEFLTSDGNASLYRVRDEKPSIQQEFKETSPVAKLYEAERLPRKVGRVIEDPRASGGRAIQAVSGDPEGFLTFGPEQVYPTGEYRVRFLVRGAAGGKPGPVGKVEVATDQGNKILAQRDIDVGRNGSGYDPIELRVRVDGPTPLEFRTHYAGTGEVRIDAVIVSFADVPDRPWRFEAEDLLRQTGRVISDAGARGGKAVQAISEISPPIYVMYGPYWFVPAGRYKARFRLRWEGVSGSGKAATLEVATDFGRKVLGESVVYPLDLTKKSGFQDVNVPFDLGDATAIDLRVKYHGSGSLWVDSVEIVPREMPGS
ncbi:MAG: hypothetical protein A2V83_02480 [Nitrospirae bacterium RBG_16_64_22]|nr:MAG: hypothetical protein A2V83_02480 [Nitrospirae bacterium RBG_16_64_22]